MAGEERKEVDIKELVAKAKEEGEIGQVFAWRTYGMDEIPITLREGERLPLGALVFVEDDDGYPIVYQVAAPHYYRPGFSHEKYLIGHGGLERDETETYDCVGILVGLFKSARGLPETPRYPVPPLSKVYRCPPELVEIVTRPGEKPMVKLGVEPVTGREVYIALRPLIRQGLIISGAQGTGKTTALLALICRSLEAYNKLRFLVLDWEGEFRPLEKLRERGFRVYVIPWDRFISGAMGEDPTIALMLMAGEDPRIRLGGEEPAYVQVIRAALVLCAKEEKYPTKTALKKLIGEVTMDERGRLKSMPGKAAFGRKPETIQTALDIVESSSILPDEKPGDVWGKKRLVSLIESNNVVLVDFSVTERRDIPVSFELQKRVGIFLAKCVWEEATSRRDFGCIIVSDEAHRICPERGYGIIDEIWLNLAAQGGRNGCPLWLVARRLSRVHKSVTTELQQNFFCFNVEDVDRRRVEEDMGAAFASLVGALPRGECVVKSAIGFRVPGQAVHVKFDKEFEPASAKYGLEERFGPLKETPPGAIKGGVLAKLW